MKKLIVSKRPLDQKEMAGEAVSVPDWWKGLTRNQRQHYLDKHKKSKLLDKLNVNDERVPRQKKAPEDKSVNVAPKENAPVTKETPAPKEQAPAIKKLENVQTENKAFKSADNKEKIKEIKEIRPFDTTDWKALSTDYICKTTLSEGLKKIYGQIKGNTTNK